MVLSVLTFSPAVQARSRTGISVTTRTGDYFGFDLRTQQNVSLGDCEKICVADTSCRAFTYNPKVKWCFLKSDYNTLNTFAGAVAGKVVDAASAEPDIGAPPALPFVTEQLLTDARTTKDNLSVLSDQDALGLKGRKDAAYRELAAGNVAPALKSLSGRARHHAR